jgi:hypothetical protein
MKVGSAPESRAMTAEEAAKARKLIATKVDWNAAVAAIKKQYPTSKMTAENLKAKKLGQYDSNPHKIVMTMAKGQSHADAAAKSKAHEMVKLMDEDFWRTIGAMAVVDIFMENGDRLINVNTGNWMVGDDHTITPIDNIDLVRRQNNMDSAQYNESAWFDRISPANVPTTAVQIVGDVWRRTVKEWRDAHPGNTAGEHIFTFYYQENSKQWIGIVELSMKNTRTRLITKLTSEKQIAPGQTAPRRWVASMRQQDPQLVDRLLNHAAREKKSDDLQKFAGF